MVHLGATQAQSKFALPEPLTGDSDTSPAGLEESSLVDPIAARVEHPLENPEISEVSEAFGRDKFTAEFLTGKTLPLDEKSFESGLRKSDRETRTRRAGTGDEYFRFTIAFAVHQHI
jgi:hypothetical protein